MTLQPLSNMTDDELIAHMTNHIQQMEEEYPDQYHTILAEGMIYHIADMARRIRSHPATAPDPEQCPDTCVYKRFAANMRNSEEHDAKVTARAREEELVELLDISKGVWNLPDMQDRIRARIKSLRTGGGK